MLTALIAAAISFANPTPAAQAVDQSRLMATIRAIPTARAARGTLDEQRGLIETEQWVARELAAIGYTPKLEPLSWNLERQAAANKNLPVDRRPALETSPELSATIWHNVIVEITGTEKPAEVLILGAHFDAVPGTPGADDNASGTAGLMEIARVLHGRPLKRTVRLIFFNLEEAGLKGSADHVRAYKSKVGEGEGKEKLIGMVSLEMLGYYSDEPNSQKSPIPRIEGVFEPPTVADFIGMATIIKHSGFARKLDAAMRAAAPDLKTFVADFPPIAPPDFLRSDHAPFLLSGLPALMLTDTSNFRNPNYHKPTDTIDTLDPVRYTLVVRALAGAAEAIANE